MRSLLVAVTVAVQVSRTLGLWKSTDSSTLRSGSSCNPRTSFTKVAVNLDLPPEERFRDVTLAYRHVSIPFALKAKANMDKYFTPAQQDEWYNAIVATIPDEYVREMRAVIEISDHPAMTFRSLTLGMGIYEMGSKLGCSGLLAAMPNGTVVHGRNMDYGLVAPVGEVTFVKNGVPFLTGANFLGGIGLSTGMRIGAWSYEQNTRMLDDESDEVRLQRNLQAIKDGGKINGIIARQIMEQVGDFQTAVQTFAETKMASPQYFIMAGAGPYEGAVITVDRIGHNRPFNNVQVLSREIGRWYLLQTNDDLFDGAKDIRRPLGLQELLLATQDQVSMDNVEAMMRGYPLYNPRATVFTWIGIPSSGEQRTLIGDSACGNPLPELGAASASNFVGRIREG